MSKRVLAYNLSLLNVDYRSLDRRWDYRNVLSPYHRLYYIDKGNGWINTDSGKYLLEPNFIYIVPAFTLCNLNCPNTLGQYYIHLFEDSKDGISLFYNNRSVIKLQADDSDILNFKRILEINPCRKINRSDNPKVYEKNVYYQEYEQLNQDQLPADFMETQGILFQLLAKFLRSKGFVSKDQHSMPAKIAGLVEYIQLNLAEDLSVKKLAGMANMHPDYFSRQFLHYIGERPLPFIHKKRIERAQYYIVTSGMSLAAIADLIGYSSMPHFFKMFKLITGFTPKEYQQSHL